MQKRPFGTIGRILGILLLAMGMLGSSTALEVSDLEVYEGRVLYLDFWASWCGPCRESFPWMNEMQEKYRDAGLVVVAVNLDSEKKSAQDFLAQVPAQFEILYDPEANLAHYFGVVGMPSSVLIDRDGGIISGHVGFRPENMPRYEGAIRRALELD